MNIEKKRFETLPNEPGIYLMKDSKGEVIYVGKAKELKKRLRSYFFGKSDQRYTLKFLLSRIADFEYIITQTEKEALILENTLIKRYKPRYNIHLRDDKTYISLRIDPKEDFPRITTVRRVKKDGARYFGPYSSAGSVREALKLLHKVFPLRTCSNSEFKRRTRPCIDYEIGKCLAPCVEFINKHSYKELTNGAIMFLQGKNRQLLKTLRSKMKSAAKKLLFEEATKLRDQIEAVEKTVEKQRVVNHSYLNQDILGVYRKEKEMVLKFLFVREGKLIGSSNFFFRRDEMPLGEIISSFLVQYYGGDRFIPNEILLPISLEDKNTLEEWLKERREGKVRLLSPRRGDKLRLVEMAEKNAKEAMKRKTDLKWGQKKLLEELNHLLSLSRFPEKIEGVDISNLFGSEATGSLVLFENGRPKKDGYRHYSIKSVTGIDDYGMMHEVISRRLRNGLKNNNLPDLLVVDGGKGHLNIALRALNSFKIDSVDIIAFAKGKNGSPLKKDEGIIGKEKLDRVYLPQRSAPVFLDKNSPSYHLLQRIRDEAHRFAITHHRKLRKRKIGSVLEVIPGVGKKRRIELLKFFGSLKNVKSASPEELNDVPTMNQKIADSIYRALHSSSLIK